MPAAAAICFLIAALFLSAARRGRLRSREWAGAQRVRARCVSVHFSVSWDRDGVADDERSSAEAALRFSAGGREMERIMTYHSVINSREAGSEVGLLYRPDDSAVALRSEVRPFWAAAAAMGALAALTGLIVAVRGREALEQISAFSPEAPNLAVFALFAAIGAVCVPAAAAVWLGLMPYALRPIVSPLMQLLLGAAGQLEEVGAVCVGHLRRSDGDGGHDYYPVFEYCGAHGRERWFPRRSVSRGRFRRGEEYALRRDMRTGRFYLPLRAADAVLIPLSLIPLAFTVMFAAALTLCAAGCIFGAAVSFCALLG